MRDRLNSLQGQKSNGNPTKDETIEVELLCREKETGLKNSFERSVVIQQWLDDIERNNVSAKQLISQLNSTFYQKDTTEKIEDLFGKNKSICFKVNNKLKEYESELAKINVESAEGRIKSIQYNGLKHRYQKLFHTNLEQMENHSKELKKSIQAQLKSKNVDVTEPELQTLIDNGADIQIFTDNIIADTAEAKRMLQDLEDRHEQLLKIETMLTEVRDLFVQIGVLVQDQQEMFDRIEHQAGIATNYVSQADAQLNEATKSKKKGIKLKIFIVIGLAFIVLVLLLVLLN